VGDLIFDVRIYPPDLTPYQMGKLDGEIDIAFLREQEYPREYILINASGTWQVWERDLQEAQANSRRGVEEALQQTLAEAPERLDYLERLQGYLSAFDALPCATGAQTRPYAFFVAGSHRCVEVSASSFLEALTDASSLLNVERSRLMFLPQLPPLGHGKEEDSHG
jgi:hypothetical protein